ncbi:putative polyketide synthase [Lentinula edodes]|nr:putative polyketide synthase [Lentinula edodes]
MPKEPVAIIGIAAEIPSGKHSSTNLDHDNFYDFLKSKKQSYEDIPLERLNIKEWHGKGLGKIIASQGSFLKDIGLFDPAEFGIGSKDARAMSVSTRRLIELSFLAFLDAGIDYRGQNVGCYASGTAFDLQSVAEPDEFEPKGSVAGLPCMIANKISYHLDLRGPSIPVDTACSSTAVATHLAVQAIRNGECKVALVAGCQLNLRASDFALYTQASILSPDGTCKPFDADGNGFARAEGAAAIVLKPLQQAIDDRDYIYGTILGTGVSACGSLAPVNAPVAESQADAMERAYDGIDRSPVDVDYVEVHGTGTAVGDPVEANWVGEKFSRNGSLLIGSVKGNIGHMEIASFLASLSKVLSILETKQVPPQVNLKTRNNAIHWDHWRLCVPMAEETLVPKNQSGKLLISMCSAGIGGVNAHAVLESPPLQNLSSENEFQGPFLLLAGGLSPRSCAAVAEDIKATLTLNPNLAIDYSLVYGRRVRQMTWRSFMIGKPGSGNFIFSQPLLTSRTKPPLAFLFSGQGPQHLNMGRQLFQRYAIFRQSILDLDVIYQAHTGKSMIHQYGLFGESLDAEILPPIWPISIVIPSLTMLHIALFDLMVSFGVDPDIFIGHSAGEVALIYASGAGTKEMAFEIAIARGQAMKIVEDNVDGTMAAISCSREDAHRIVRSITARSQPQFVLEVACYNSLNAVAISGHSKLIDEAILLAQQGGFLAKKITTKVPVHSRAMELCEAQYRSAIQEVFSRYPGSHKPRKKTYSTCTGRIIEDFDANYFWTNTRNPVLFTQTMDALIASNPGVYVVEMGPHPVLAAYVQEAGVLASSYVCPMRRSKNIIADMEEYAVLTALGSIIVAGYNFVNFSAIYPCSDRVARVKTPAYPFVKKHIEYWPEVSRIMSRQISPRNGPLNYPDLRINVHTHPELAGHIINSQPIMPAAGFIEMGFELGVRTLWKIKFHSILPLTSLTPPLVAIEVEGSRYEVRSCMAPSSPLFFHHNVNEWKIHAEGYFSNNPVDCSSPTTVQLSELMEYFTAYNKNDFYQHLSSFAQYGNSFKRIDQIFIYGREALVRVKSLDESLSGDGKYILHPAILDSCFHACVHPLLTKATDPNIYYLPSVVNCISLSDKFNHSVLSAEHFFAHIKLKQWNPDNLVYDIELIAPDGLLFCTIQGFIVQQYFHIPPEAVHMRFELQYQTYGISRDPDLDLDQGELQNANFSSIPVLEYCKKLFNYTINKCDRKCLHIVEIHHLAFKPFGETLTNMVLKAGGLQPLYTLATSATSGAHFADSSDILPTLSNVIAYQFSLTDMDRLPYSVDLITTNTLLEVPNINEGLLQALILHLVPGGSIVLKMLITPLYEKDFNSLLEQLMVLNFEPRFVPVVAENVGILEARRPFIVPIIPPEISLPFFELPLIIEYGIGREMILQQHLKTIKEEDLSPIWIVTSEGPDADAFSGLFRTLIREFPNFNLRGASFSPCYYSSSIRQFIIHKYLPPVGPENEFYIGENLHISVPRIIPMTGLSARTSSQSYLPCSADVMIEVSASSPFYDGLWGVVGTVTEGHQSSLEGARVVGIALCEPSGGRVSLIDGFFTRSGVDFDSFLLARIAPIAMIVGLAVGINALNDPTHFRARIIVTHSDTFTGTVAVELLKIFGLAQFIKCLPSLITPITLFNAQIQCEDIVISGLELHNELLESYLPEETQVTYWTTTKHLLTHLRRHSHFAGYMLELLTRSLSEASLPLQFPDSNLDLKMAQPYDIENTKLENTKLNLDPNKIYLLIGGLGSFGPFAALWMYEKGARHIVLTSRSGRQSIDRMSDCLPSRILEYLEGRAQLTLAMEAVDGSDSTAMASFDDRLFFDQDTESFRKSFQSKIGTLDALEKVIDIKKLDFLVSLSSMTIWGNSGQTNYTSANTALDGRLRQYRNAFSIAAPAINDTSSMIRGVDETQASHLSFTACSASELCNWIEDGILKLAEKHFDVYVPPYNFDTVSKTIGPSNIYAHLCSLNTLPKESTSQVVDIHDLIRSLVTQFIDIPSDELSNEVPLTSYGLSSIEAGRLAYGLKPYLIVSQMQLLSDMTVADLIARAQLMETSKQSIHKSDEQPHTRNTEEAAQEMDVLISKYSLGFDPNGLKLSGPFIHDSVVFITGTTGALGSYILVQLVKSAGVKKIYAFNRPSDALTIRERQHAVFSNHNLDLTLLDTPKLVFIEGDASQIDLGLDPTTYEDLREEITVIIDNAWQLDLNAPLRNFISNIASTRNLIDLAYSSSRVSSIRYTFISSIASAQNWISETGGHEEVPEEILENSKQAAMFGYGESKYVAEKLVSMSGLQASVYRVGQLCGASESGSWTIKEWIPKLTRTSLSLNAVPDMGGIVSWIPIDKVASIVIEITLDPTSSPPPPVLNIIHPRPVTWTSIMEIMLKDLLPLKNTGETMKMKPYMEWVGLLEAVDGNGTEMRKKNSNGTFVLVFFFEQPAFALLDRIRDFGAKSPIGTDDDGTGRVRECGGWPWLSSKKSVERSRTMRKLLDDADEMIGERQVTAWIAYWKQEGLLPIVK